MINPNPKWFSLCPYLTRQKHKNKQTANISNIDFQQPGLKKMDSANTYSGYCVKSGGVGVIVPFFFQCHRVKLWNNDCSSFSSKQMPKGAVNMPTESFSCSLSVESGQAVPLDYITD